MLFALRKGWFIYAKQNKTFKLEYCEKTSSAICAIFDNRAFERWSDFRLGKKIILLYLKKPRWFRLLLN